MVLSGATLTAEEFPRVLALSFLLKEKENTGCPIILSMMFLPMDSNSCTLTSSFATIPLMIFLNQGSEEKGEHLISFVLIFKRSDASLSILASVESLYCSFVVSVR